MLNLELRDYQQQSIEGLRAGIRDGHKRQILCAPTGAGKSVCAAFLIQEALNKYTRTYFIVDRISLLDQSVSLFHSYGIDCGVIQGQHYLFRPWEKLQVCSAATLARRGNFDGVKLMLIDECHIQNKVVTNFLLEHPDIATVGFSATPMTRGLGKVYSNVVNVTTTDRLIEEGWLTKIKAFAAKAIDMKDAKVKSTGEWDDKAMEDRGIAIVGDVIAEWVEKTNANFGGPVKTIVFSATVAHGEELCRRFQEAGFNFQQVSYKDKNDDARRNLIEEFRKPDSEVMGLISCEALGRGFDVPQIQCGIFCRPYRKSLSSWIQQLGRIMRPYPGKEFSLALDHSGNMLRFFDDANEFFANGIAKLSEQGLDNKVRPEPNEDDKKANACGGCGYLMRGPTCPACGWERPARQNMVQELPGTLHEITLDKTRASAIELVLQDKDAVWRQICHHALDRKNGDITAAERFAKAQYRSLYGTWPRHAMRNITPEAPHYLLINKIKQNLIAWSRRAKS